MSTGKNQTKRKFECDWGKTVKSRELRQKRAPSSAVGSMRRMRDYNSGSILRVWMQTSHERILLGFN